MTQGNTHETDEKSKGTLSIPTRWFEATAFERHVQLSKPYAVTVLFNFIPYLVRILAGHGCDPIAEPKAEQQAARMTFYTLPQTMFRSRSIKRCLFRDAIIKIGASKYGPDWAEAVVHLEPLRLPDTMDNASQDHIAYAVHILRRADPNLEFKQIEQKIDESAPSELNNLAPRLDISEKLWKKARDAIDQDFEQQFLLHSQFTKVLDMFADAAYSGTLKVYARHRDTFAEKEVDTRFWEVDGKTLLLLYGSCRNDLWQTNKDREHYRVVVDTDSLSALFPGVGLDNKSKEDLVREKLREAVSISKTIVPHGTIRQLRKDIAQYLGCDLKKVNEIITEETGNCWSARGRRGKEFKSGNKQIRICD